MSKEKQYDQFADDFSAAVNNDLVSRKVFYGILGKDLQSKSLLDVACGDGIDMIYYQSLGAEVSGIDASAELIEIAKTKLPGVDLKVGVFEQLPFEDNSFDVVVSKYAIQTSAELKQPLQELTRVTKPGGLIVYLTLHPIRQFMEKKSKFRDYYKQEVVDSVLFNGAVVVQEHSHTMNEYLNEESLAGVRLVSLTEGTDFSDTSAQQVGGDYYPTFMILKLIKL